MIGVEVLKPVFHYVSVVLLTLILLVFSIHYFEYVQLPNGFILVSDGVFENRISLRDVEGKKLIHPQVSGVSWKGEYVFGEHWDSSKRKKSYFINKIGWKEPFLFTDQKKFYLRLDEKKIIDALREDSAQALSDHYSYLELKTDFKYQRNWWSYFDSN